MKAAIAFLVLVALGLGIGLMVRHKNAVQTHQADQAVIGDFSNRVEVTKAKLDDAEKMAMYLETNLTIKAEELSGASNNLNKLNAELAKTRNEMQAAAEAARAEIAKKDAQITQLTTETNALTVKMDDLTSNIYKLGKLISDTEKKLTASEGDREFLLGELKRLQVEKAELEKQFNDLATLRAQVSKIKEELTVARRLEWLRMGIYGVSEKKGAEKLMTKNPAAPATNNFSLNVELKQNGGATIITNKAPVPAPPK